MRKHDKSRISNKAPPVDITHPTIPRPRCTDTNVNTNSIFEGKKTTAAEHKLQEKAYIYLGLYHPKLLFHILNKQESVPVMIVQGIVISNIQACTGISLHHSYTRQISKFTLM